MQETLSPLITDIGFQQLFNAEQNGLQLELTQVGLGAGAYSPNQAQTALQQEQERIAIIDGPNATCKKLLPRITELIQEEVTQLDPADFTEIMGVVASFFTNARKSQEM